MEKVSEKPCIERRGQYLVCPICGRECRHDNAGQAEKTAFWQHYFRANHRQYRPISENHTAHIKTSILTAKRQWKAELATVEAEKIAAEKQQKDSDIRHANRLYPVSGEFLDEVAEAVGKLIGMMEPYYAQCGGDATGDRILKKLEDLRSNAEGQV